MKKVSGVRTIRPLPPLSGKNSNMRHPQGDQEKNREFCMTDDSCIVEQQTAYIENLLGQIYTLENEMQYLRMHIHETGKQHPSMIAEGEKLVKKLSECHTEIKNMKVEMKRKQTTIDLLRSENDRIQRYKGEVEEKFRKEKCRILEEIFTARKERDSAVERNAEVEQLLQNLKQNERNLLEDIDNLKITVEQMKKETSHDKEIIGGLLQEKETLQKQVLELKMKEEARPDHGAETIKTLKMNIEELHEITETSKRCADHEKLLRERLSEDNDKLIRRYAKLESELAEVRAHLREEECRRESLEQLHLNTIVEASEAKNRDETLKEEIAHLKEELKEEAEHSHSLTLKLAEEQRFKAREEERFTHLTQKLEQKEEQMKKRDRDNIELMRDNTYLKDSVLHLKEQIKSREEEVTSLKQKVQEMQVSVEEFIQSTQNANRITGERWKQLSQLAQGITALTSIAEPPNT